MTATKFDTDKETWSLIPFQELKEVLKVLSFGANKYSKDNWKLVEPERYKEASMRHLVAFFEGEWLDEDSGLPHLAHLACNCLFLLWGKENWIEFDKKVGLVNNGNTNGNTVLYGKPNETIVLTEEQADWLSYLLNVDKRYWLSFNPEEQIVDVLESIKNQLKGEENAD